VTLYRPPAPIPRTPVRGLIRAMLSGERDLLSLLPDIAYTTSVGPLGQSRRGIVIVNDPALVTQVLIDADQVFPKNDLLVGALEAVVGTSMFVSSGDTWRRQRRMIDPAFSHMRVNRAFDAMQAGITAYETTLDAHAATQDAFSLDAAMSQMTADIICRTIFTQSLASSTARDVFAAFGQFERSVANTEIMRLLFGKPFAKIPQKQKVIEACTLIRRHIGDLLDPRLAEGATPIDDIVGAVIAARDPETGQAFTREELIDQIGVFFLAGHETTASVLTWIFYILSQNPGIAERIRHEVEAVTAGGEIRLEHTKQLTFVRNVFREAMRLYPPITFIPRVAQRDTELAGIKLKRGCMVMIAPWTIHRSGANWSNPDRFDPDRFTRDGEIPSGAYIPFGLGPRICVGAAFATIESTLILARLVRRYDFTPLNPETVRPVARLTTKPVAEIMCRVRLRPGPVQVA
jgi:cytochrome P450